MIWLRIITFMVVTCLCALIVSGLLEDLKVYKRDNDHLLIGSSGGHPRHSFLCSNGGMLFS
nr:MAG TPA: hypothetical protein [Caudoviricetes sp.]